MKFNIIFLLIFAITVVKSENSSCVDNKNCIEEKLTEIIEKFDEEERIPLFGGLEIIKTIKKEPVTIENKSGNVLLERIRRYVSSHEIVLNRNRGSSRGFEEDARTVKKLKKFLLPLLLALKFKMTTVLAVFLTLLTVIAIKGVFAGLFSLLLSGFTALKSLGEKKNDHLTAVLSIPVHGNLHTHGQKWDRQDMTKEQQPLLITEEALNLPYADYQYSQKKIAYH